MQQKQKILASAGLFLVLASASYAADTPAGAMANPTPAAASNLQPPVVNDPGKVYLIRENSFFWNHINKSLEHARKAEMAGNLGQAAELREHANMSLIQAREAQRAGNVSGLNEGIANLRKALGPPPQASASPSSVQGVEPAKEPMQASASPSAVQGVEPTKEPMQASASPSAVQAVEPAKELSGTSREETAVRSATDFVREARKNLSQAGGVKYVAIQPQGVVAVSTGR